MVLSDFSVRHPVIISILLVVLLVFGTLAFISLNREMTPPVGLPQAHVITTWPGAGAEEVEETVTRPIENRLSTLGGMSSMTSTSKDSYSVVALEFTDGTDVYARLPEIRELLNLIAADLPDDTDGPPEILMSEANSLLPVFSFQVISTVEPVRLARFLDDEVAPRLARIPGVARINIVGAAEEEVRITLDPDKGRARDVTATAVLNTLRYANANVPAGEAFYRGRQLPLTAEGTFTSLEDICRLVVGSHEGAYVYLGDVAVVDQLVADPDIVIRSGGSNTVVVDVMKRDDGNTIEIVNRAQAELDRISVETGVFTWRTVSDHREMTNRSINTVITSALVGTLLATLVILLFLHDIRATLIIALSIPISVLFAFGAMYLSGRTINLLTLSGITVAIGMIVDASIVTLENTWKHFHHSGDRLHAARTGAGEVGSAILASTLTSVSVFIPLAFLTGVIGIIMTDLSLTIVYALIAAAVVAVVVVPFLSSILLRPENAPRKNRFIAALDGKIDDAFGALQGLYRRTLERAMGDTIFVVLLAVAILATSIVLLTALSVSFLPATDTGEFEIHIDTPRTYSLEQTRDVVDTIDHIVSEVVPEIQTAVYYVGASSSLAIAGSPNQAYGRIRLVEGSRRDRSVQELIPLVQHALDRHVPEADVTVLNGGFDALLGLATGGQGYQLEVYGTQLEEVVALADTAREHLAGDPDVLKAETNTDYDAEQLSLQLFQGEMGSLGVSTYEAGMTARILLNGVSVGNYTAGDDDVPILLVSALEGRPVGRDTVHNLYMKNSEGTILSFAAFSEVTPRRAVSTIHKRDRSFSATVRGYLYDEDQSGVSLRMGSFMNSLDIPPGLNWERAGTSELIVDSMRSLSAMLALAIFLVYVVMVIQFERYLQPLVIMAAIPFCLIGVVLGLLVFSSALSIIAMLGLITLGGTVVNNAIVMVDYINTLRRRDGMELNEAIIQGASGRLRPVLMTTMTTIFAVLPMALAVGDGSEVYAPLGQAIFGGMLTSTAITLFIVPVLYRFIERWSVKGNGTSVITLLLVTAGLLAGQTPVQAQTAVDSLRDEAARQSSRLGSLIVFDADHFPAEPDGSFIKTNRDIAVQEGELRAAGADVRGAVAMRFPAISARVDAAWLTNPADPVTLEAGELGTIPFSENPMLGMEDVVLPAEQTELFEGSGDTRYELGLSLVQPIFAWRTIENAVAAAEAAERLAAARLAGTRHAVLVEAATVAETVAILGAVDESLALQAEAAERLVSISRENWSNGFITETEYLDARLARQEVLLARAEVAEKRGIARERLRILTGAGTAPATKAQPRAGTPPETEAPPRAGALSLTEDELIRRASRGSWELLALEEAHALGRARERIAAGSRTLRPDVGFRLDMSWTGALEDAGESQWEDRGEWQVTLGLGISATLFDGGRSAAAYERATEESLKADLHTLDREERIAADIRNRLQRLETLKARLEHTAVVLSVRSREVADTRAAWDAGAGGEADFLRTIIDQAAATAEGYDRLAAYRSELWALAGILGAEAFR